MKKGILNIVLLVLILINLVMTLVLTFSIVPAMRNSNKLVEKIASIIDLEIVDPNETGGGSIPASQKEVYQIAEKLTNKLADDSDGGVHYAVGYAAVYLDKEHEDYETYSAIMPDQDTTISSRIKKVMANYTMNEFDQDIGAVEEEVLKDLQEYFGSKVIVEVVLDMVAN